MEIDFCPKSLCTFKYNPKAFLKNPSTCDDFGQNLLYGVMHQLIQTNLW